MRDGQSITNVFEREQRLLTRFRQRSLAYWPGAVSQSDWDHLFAMQHYGLPTRLLDWSENLMVSAFFALRGATASCAKDEDLPVIWCVDPVEWNRQTPSLSGYGETIHVLTTANEEAESYRPFSVKKMLKYPIAIYGSHNSERIVAQRGTFFVWGNDTSPLETFVQEDVRATIWRFTMTGDATTHFHDLQRLGFSETMIFPELPYLADELNRMEGWRS